MTFGLTNSTCVTITAELPRQTHLVCGAVVIDQQIIMSSRGLTLK